MLFEPGSVPLVYTDGAVARAMKVDLAPAPGRDLHSSGRIGITRGTRPRLRSAQSRGRRRARLRTQKRNPLKSSGLWCRFGVRENRKNFPKKRLDGILHLGYIGRYLSEFLPTLLRIELATSDSGSFFLSDTIFENRIVCVSL